MFNEFYKGRKVFITGHTGFKGSWLVLWLKALGAEVKGYALKPKTNDDIFIAAQVNQLCSSVIADVRDKGRLEKEVNSFKPEVVFHLAAQPLVLMSYEQPVETYSTNIMGTVNLLEAVRKCRTVKSLVNITTDKCYRNIGKAVGYIEEDCLGGYDPYSSSKACSELVTEGYRQSFFNKQNVQISTARAGNVIGGGDWSKDRIMTDIITSLKSGKPVSLRNPGAVRPWQHVLEPLSGYLWLAAQSDCKYEGAWNFGPREDHVVKVGDIAKECIKIWGAGGLECKYDSKAPHEAKILLLNCGKGRKELKWKPILSIPENLRFTIDWYKKHSLSPRSMREYSLSQIYEYCKLAKRHKLKWTM